MTKSEAEAPVAGRPAKGDESQGFLRDWVVPVVLGLALGTGAFAAWPYVHRAFRSEVQNLVGDWTASEERDDDALREKLTKLGPGVRGDLVSALLDLPHDAMDQRICLARLLASEPWFDTASLKEILKDQGAAKADRRAAACALLDIQVKEVDTELILPVLEEWLGDAKSLDRVYAVQHAERMWRSSMLNTQWEGRIKAAFLALAEKPAVTDPETRDFVSDARAFTLLGLSAGMPDGEIKAALWKVAKDETDDEFVRNNAVRSLAESGVTDAADVEDWVALGRSASGMLRQSVADNLSRAAAPVYDKVLEPLQYDEFPLTRHGAVMSQTDRRRPTMLARFDELIEDSDETVRFRAMFAAGVMKNDDQPGLAARAAMILRLLESSDNRSDVEGAILALRLMTDESYGFSPTDIHLREQTVEDAPLTAFMADKAGRKGIADQYRAKFGAAAVWTDADRIRTLQKLLKHADPANVERAKSELAALGVK